MKNIFSEFAKICQTNDLETSINKIREIKNVSADISQMFYDEYSNAGELDIKQAFEQFWVESNFEKQILDWIDDKQKNTTGIYPYHVAVSVAMQFNIDITYARELVQKHIQEILAK